MGLNKANHQLADRLVQQIAQIQRDLQDLKTKQRIGADNIVVSGANVVQALTGVMAAGTVTWFVITVTPSDGVLHLFDLFLSVFVDGQSESNLADLFPTGSDLVGNPGGLKTRILWWADWATSSDSSGVRKYFVGIENYDTASHHYEVDARLYSAQTPTS